MQSRFVTVLGVCALIWSAQATRVGAQQSCDDFNDCMSGSMCLPDGSCGGGTPLPDGTPCGQTIAIPCMTNPTCTSGFCSGGDFAAPGTPCKLVDSLCFTEGTCEQVVPEFPFTTCQNSAFIQCPQDNDPCTFEFCNVNTGQCDSGSACFVTSDAPDFQCADATCNPANGQCTFRFKNEGGACDDFDQCTANSRCSAGQCLSGEPTGPTATPTATEATEPTSTPTPIQGGCVGDCNEDGEVTIDDLIIMVNIAQGSQSVNACTNGDANSDGEITIDEILLAVNAALNGC
jgi:hypothetical protein